MKPIVFVVLTAAMVAASSGCRDSTPGRFVYTPVPYTVVTFPPVRGTPQPTMVISIEESGQPYSADLVLVTLDKSAKARFMRWANSLGFTVESDPESDNYPFDFIFVSVRVPLGSAADALKLIRKQHGVRDAGLSHFAGTLGSGGGQP
jgi:hypothetical protein